MNWLELLSSKRNTTHEQRNEDTRSPFLIDVDRILFSKSFRRLQDKTQVHPLAKGSVVRTRLTHSLEVASIGRSIGYTSAKNIIKKFPNEIPKNITEHDFGYILQASGLIHDIGNPPFGHQGEAVMQNFYTKMFNEYSKEFSDIHTFQKQDLINFDGNAQGFRIINNNSLRMPLTYATLGTFLKYPRMAFNEGHMPGHKIGDKKIGIMQSEKEIFIKLTEELGLEQYTTDVPLYQRHPLVFLLEASDDICYSIADIEDAVTVGVLPFNIAERYLAPIVRSPKKYKGDAEARLYDLKNQEFYKGLTDDKKLEFLSAKSIANLVDETIISFNENIDEIMLGNFNKELLQSTVFADEIKECKRLFFDKIINHSSKIAQEITGLEVIEVILLALTKAYFTETNTPKSRLIRRYYGEEQLNLPVYERLLWINDMICDMTDHQAVQTSNLLIGNIK